MPVVQSNNNLSSEHSVNNIAKWKKINSVANRLITFDGSIEHASTDCTNATARVNINFNYL